MGWIGVDLDGTLARFDGMCDRIGEPVPAMLARVKAWLQRGIEVRIMTARASTQQNSARRAEQVEMIHAWCRKHIGFELDVTSEKDYDMLELWDDRAIHVQHNTGAYCPKSGFTNE